MSAGCRWLAGMVLALAAGLGYASEECQPSPWGPEDEMPEGAPHEVLLILDANNGQNAIAQAEEFGKALDMTGLFLTKLDGTAKGGAVIGIRHQIDVPVKFIGIGEKAEDIEEFDAEAFVEALFS